MLGFDQQAEVKKRIADIAFGTKLFISKKQIICSITKAPVLGKVDMRVRMHWTIQNPTSESLPYNYGLAWERAERPTQATLGMISGDSNQLDSPAEDPQEPGVWRIQGTTTIEPHSSREFCATYRTMLADDFYHNFATVTPVIDTTLTVEAPEDLRIEVNRGYTESNPVARTWRYANLAMPGERVTVRWFRSSS
jgi:hypothetical protein